MRHAILMAVLLGLPLGALADDLQPGKYRQTLTSDTAGAKPQSGDQCITQKDIDSGLSKVGLDDDADCKVSDFKRGSGTVSYRLTCEEDGKRTTATTSGSFTRDSYDFRVIWQPPGNAKPTTVHAIGKRIGACGGK